MRQRSWQVALCGVLAAVATAIMALGGMIPASTYCCPVLASLALLPVREECGEKIAWCQFSAIALLSLLFSPDKEAASLFLVIGYYPILQPRLNRLRVHVLRWLCKLVLFNTVICVMYAVLLFVLRFDALSQEFAEMQRWFVLLLLLAGNVVFLLYDLFLVRIQPFYKKLVRPRLHRK